MPVRVPPSTPTKPSSSSEPSSNSGNKLRVVNIQEALQWKAAISTRSEYACHDLEDNTDYPFKDQDVVWVRTKADIWHCGKVVGQSIRVGRTRGSKQGLFYPVNFGTKQNIRKYFSPLNGEIKLDTENVRQLLVSQGWIDDLDEDDNSTDSSDDFYEEE